MQRPCTVGRGGLTGAFQLRRFYDSVTVDVYIREMENNPRFKEKIELCVIRKKRERGPYRKSIISS